MSASSGLNEGASELSGARGAESAQRVPLLRPDGDAPYSVWRPRMETFMMRVGIEPHDYNEAIPEWATLVAMVASNTKAVEKAERARFLSGGRDGTQTQLGLGASASTQTGTAGNSPATTVEKVPAVVAASMERSRRAYGLLDAALPKDIQLLIADVPRGYAYGIWSFLERRYQNTDKK